MNVKGYVRIASPLMLLAVILASCAPAAAPAPTPKPAAPAAKPAEKVPTAKPAATPEAKPAAPAATPKPAADQPRSGGILHISMYALVQHYDIHQNTSVAGMHPMQHAYNNVVAYDPLDPEKIVGDLAQSWDMSQDGTVFTFRLHPGVKWQDGKSFTSADARFTLERIQNPPRGTVVPRIRELVQVVKSVETPDAQTLKLTLKNPSASFLGSYATSWFAVFPKHVIEEKGDMKRTIMGTGPFRFKSDVPGSSFELTKNADYFKKGRPYLDGIRYYVLVDASTRFAAFRTKRVQLAAAPYGLMPEQLETVKSTMPQVTTAQYQGATWFGLYVMTTKQPWSDLRVRKAMSLAIDRQLGVKTVESTAGAVAGPIPPGSWSLPEDELLKMPGFRQPKDADRAEARKLLAEAGQANLKFSMLFRTGARYAAAAEFLKDQLGTIGVEMSLKPIEYTQLLDLVNRHDFDAAMMMGTWTIYDPDDLLLQFYRSDAVRNYGVYKDAEIDKLVDEQSRMLDQAKRKEMVLQTQRIILDRVPFVLSHWANYIAGWWPEVKNFKKPLSQFSYFRLEDVWLAQ
ncbi:MAG: ABC transporter substrate-binding protein [Chloroflexi bacterium]|nr:ABC transporter substrate-binding protein [Chloroflexota bacterium]